MTDITALAQRIRNYLDMALKSGVKLSHLTTDELSGLLDELGAAQARIAELEKAATEPVAWTDEQELRDVERSGCGYLFTVNPITPNADQRRVIKLYTVQPALESRTVTVKLPDEVLKLAQAPQHLSKHDQLCWMSGANWMRMEAVKLNPAAGIQVIEGEGH